MNADSSIPQQIVDTIRREAWASSRRAAARRGRQMTET
jgi:hypothetical protein